MTAGAVMLVGLAFVVGRRILEQPVDPAVAISPAMATSKEAEGDHRGFLHGRITTVGDVTYEGRLRWGGDGSAFWGDYFYGVKKENIWSVHVPAERLPKERSSIKIFGFEIARQDRRADLERPFMARFGDLGRLDLHGRDMRATLKSGTVVELDRFASNDVDNGVRVWDDQHGTVDLDARWIRSVEFLAPAAAGAVPARLQGTVQTKQGDFTGFIQWNRFAGVGSDALEGHAADGELRVRFDAVRSIARVRDGSSVMLFDGREMVLSGSRDVGQGNRGIYVNDRRYGRVLISWKAVERVDFSSGGSGPAYGDFLPGRPLSGSVTTRSGRRFVGRLVYDLDESETTETLDAPSRGVNYAIPFGLIVSIMLGHDKSDGQHARVILKDGEELQLELAGDLGEGNAGLLVFVEGPRHPEYLPWADVEQIDFRR